MYIKVIIRVYIYYEKHRSVRLVYYIRFAILIDPSANTPWSILETPLNFGGVLGLKSMLLCTIK